MSTSSCLQFFMRCWHQETPQLLQCMLYVNHNSGVRLFLIAVFHEVLAPRDTTSAPVHALCEPLLWCLQFFMRCWHQETPQLLQCMHYVNHNSGVRLFLIAVFHEVLAPRDTTSAPVHALCEPLLWCPPLHDCSFS